MVKKQNQNMTYFTVVEPVSSARMRILPVFFQMGVFWSQRTPFLFARSLKRSNTYYLNFIGSVTFFCVYKKTEFYVTLIPYYQKSCSYALTLRGIIIITLLCRPFVCVYLPSCDYCITRKCAAI